MKKAFNILELIITVSIIGIIVIITMIAFNYLLAWLRDTQRLSDIKQIQLALEVYKKDHGCYPPSLEGENNSLFSSSTSESYLRILPQNPRPRKEQICPDNNYIYWPRRGNSNYMIDFCLESKVGSMGPGRKCAVPRGIMNLPCASCPSSDCFGEIYLY